MKINKQETIQESKNDSEDLEEKDKQEIIQELKEEPKDFEEKIDEITRVEFNIKAKPKVMITINQLFGDYQGFTFALNDCSDFVSRHSSETAFLTEATNFLVGILADSDILGNIPVCLYPKMRAKTEKLLESIAVETGNLDNILSNKDIYKQVRADNIDEITGKYGTEPLLAHYLDVRYSGLTILGEDAALRYVEEGKYQSTRYVLDKDIYSFTYKAFLGDSPYVYSSATNALYYYGRKLPFEFQRVDANKGISREEKTQLKHWYFKVLFGQGRPETGEVDFSYLTINFHNFCENMCPFCWRAYSEKTKFFGEKAMRAENISADNGLQEIEEAYGPEIFKQIKRISVVEGGFKSEQEELAFLEELITKLKDKGFKGKIKAFTAFIEDFSGFDKLKSLGYEMTEFVFPLESFTRRNETLGKNKQITFEEVLSRVLLAKKYYDNVKVFLLVGLADNLDDLRKYLPILRENGIDVQLGAYMVSLPRQHDLLSKDIRKDEMNNGHLSFYFEVAKIASQYGIGHPTDTIHNAIWPKELDKLVHEDSIIRDKEQKGVNHLNDIKL